MKKMLATLGLSLLLAVPLANQAATPPKQDLKEFRAYFAKRFPDTPFDDYINGVYSIDQAAREEWMEIEAFPPYEFDIDTGKELFETPFANGQTYADCFENGGIGIRQNYPYFDTGRGEVITLELAINECRRANGEKTLRWGRGPLAQISAYMAFTSRGNAVNVEIPDDPRALEWYARGKRHFFQKRGQLNMSCADCHLYYAGYRLRAESLSPAIGQTTHWPVYRSVWGDIGTLHRRYYGCNQQVRARPHRPQSEEFRALEYFHSYLSNGLELNGPGARR